MVLRNTPELLPRSTARSPGSQAQGGGAAALHHPRQRHPAPRQLQAQEKNAVDASMALSTQTTLKRGCLHLVVTHFKCHHLGLLRHPELPTAGLGTSVGHIPRLPTSQLQKQEKTSCGTYPTSRHGIIGWKRPPRSSSPTTNPTRGHEHEKLLTSSGASSDFSFFLAVFWVFFHMAKAAGKKPQLLISHNLPVLQQLAQLEARGRPPARGSTPGAATQPAEPGARHSAAWTASGTGSSESSSRPTHI